MNSGISKLSRGGQLAALIARDRLLAGFFGLLAPSGRKRFRSFDVFDTAITRIVFRPDHIHWFVAERAQLEQRVGMQPSDWRRLRVDAEHAAVRARPDPSLADIYEVVRSRVTWDGELVDELLRTEVQAELDFVRPIASTRDLAARNFPDHLFISDTYFTRAQVQDLLSRCGYRSELESIYSSSEHKKSKAAGDFFRHSYASAGIDPREVLHLGDNYRSDVVRARMAGVAAEHCETKPTDYERVLYSAKGGSLSSIIAGCARAARLGASKDDGVNIIASNVGGPVLLAFVLWVLLKAKADGLRRLYFIARDGQILQRIGEAAAAWAGIDIECRYLLGSRQAFHLASFDADPDKRTEQIIDAAQNKPMSEVLDELELPLDAGLLAKFGLSANTVILDRPLLKALLTEESVARQLAHKAEARTSAITDYFRAEGVFDDAALGIVDLGWKGNIQLRLEKILNKGGHRLPIGYYYDLIENPPSLAGRTFTFASNRRWHPALLESLCLATHGSVKGFGHAADGQVQPILMANDPIGIDVENQQTAIMRFVDLLLSQIKAEPEALLQALRPGAEAALELFAFSPGFAEGDAYGRILHASEQTHARMVELAPKAGFVGVLRMLTSNSYRRAHTQWIQGVVARSSRSLPVRCLWIVLRAKNRLGRAA